MLEIAKKHQVLCVTHLPNYYISKKDEDGRTKTSLTKLNEEEIIKEIARIIGGDITEYSIMNAKELREERKGI